VLAAETRQKNADGLNVPVSSSIYVFEEKKKSWAYIWKSAPLTTVDERYRLRGEGIIDITSGPWTNDHSLHVKGEKNTYRLSFQDGYYVLQKAPDDGDNPATDSDLKQYFKQEISSWFQYERNGREYLFVLFTGRDHDRIHIYRIRPDRNRMFQPAGTMVIPGVSRIWVFYDSSKKKSILVSYTEDHELRMVSLKLQ
jgi:hypothetical protein